MYDLKMYNKNSLFLTGKDINDLAIVFITTEGIQHLAGGVGQYIKNFILTLCKNKRKLSEKGLDLTIYAGEPAVNRVIPSYSKQNFELVTNEIRESGGEFYQLLNNTYGENWIGNIENWKVMSASAASVVFNIAQKHKATLVFTGCSCFSMLPVYIHKQIKLFRNVDIRTIFLTHDSAYSDFYLMKNEDVLSMDFLTSQWCKYTPNAKIGYVSEYMKNLFSEKFFVSEEAFIKSSSGVLISDLRYKPISQNESREWLTKYHIPTDKKILMSWGRAEGYKRFDVVFSAGELLSNEYFTVVVTNTKYPELRKYMENIDNENMLLIESYKGFDLIKALICYKKTEVIAFMSDNEPGSMSPLEAMLLLKEENAIVVANNSGMYSEIIEEGINGYLIENIPKKLAKKVNEIEQLSVEDRKRINQRAYHKVCQYYNQEINYLETIGNAVQQIRKYIN